MLVHPDKNMGNEKAAEAFKKLQNAYEVIFFFFLFLVSICIGASSSPISDLPRWPLGVA